MSNWDAPEKIKKSLDDYVVIIATGGTISCKKSDKGLTTDHNVLLKILMKKYKDRVHEVIGNKIVRYNPDNVPVPSHKKDSDEDDKNNDPKILVHKVGKNGFDSAAASQKDWGGLVSLSAYYVMKKPLGIVVTHGTDTLSYSAAALCFGLKWIPIPIILTAAQITLEDDDNDGLSNLIGAIEIASRPNGVILPEVCVYMNRKIMCAYGIVKLSSHNIMAFDTPGYDYYGEKSLNDYVFDLDLLRKLLWVRVSNGIKYGYIKIDKIKAEEENNKLFEKANYYIEMCNKLYLEAGKRVFYQHESENTKELSKYLESINIKEYRSENIKNKHTNLMNDLKKLLDQKDFKAMEKLINDFNPDKVLDKLEKYYLANKSRDYIKRSNNEFLYNLLKGYKVKIKSIAQKFAKVALVYLFPAPESYWKEYFEALKKSQCEGIVIVAYGTGNGPDEIKEYYNLFKVVAICSGCINGIVSEHYESSLLCGENVISLGNMTPSAGLVKVSVFLEKKDLINKSLKGEIKHLWLGNPI